MSGSYDNTDGRSDSFNAGAAHDTGLYDPNRHDNQIVAVYEHRAAAEAARDALLGAGVPSGAVQVLDRTAGDAASGATRAEDRNQEEGFWGAVKSLFVPDEDYTAYHHALGRGHAMVVVTPGAGMDRSRVIQILESSDPVDFDAKLEEWRQAGYDDTQAPRAAVGAAQGMGTSGSRMLADNAPPPASREARAMDSGPDRSVRTDVPGERAARPATTAPANTTTRDTGSADTINVIEERLRVGKREVAQGAVRVRSYVVERPVEEQVRLHEERITLDRRPVDRAVTAADTGAFQERTIEARATSEEAVVNKEARVVEEIGLRKDASERTETVRDNVRETKVEVEDTTGAGRAGRAGMGTGGTVTNATPGATSSGTNAPRK